jgi:glycine/D-amino acid oxidase-like deaminating enzyme/nitrite reductase/ring-hydroxylating ferredoxin subunit
LLFKRSNREPAMNVAQERTKSLWMGTPVADAPPLAGEHSADVVIIGSGIAGLSTGYELMSRGRSVMVIDRGAIGSGMTARTSAHLVSALDDRYAELIKTRGLDVAKVVYAKRSLRARTSTAISAASMAICSWRPKPLPQSSTTSLPPAHKRASPLHAGNRVRSLRFPDQARFHPLKYLAGLARVLVNSGAKLFANTAVEGAVEENGDVVVTTFVCSLAARARTSSSSAARTTNQARPTTAKRVTPGSSAGRAIGFHNSATSPIVGRPGHGARRLPRIPGAQRGRSASLSDHGRLRAGTDEWRHRLAARQPADPQFLEAFDPGRNVARHVREFIGENLTVLKSFAEYFTTGEIKSIGQLRLGEGAVFRSGMKKVAACRDAHGALHLRSATCTHMGCVVHWNSLEQCWDCPCHGSQFAPDGTPLNGPAVVPLAEVQQKERLVAAE